MRQRKPIHQNKQKTKQTKKANSSEKTIGKLQKHTQVKQKKPMLHFVCRTSVSRLKKSTIKKNLKEIIV